MMFFSQSDRQFLLRGIIEVLLYCGTVTIPAVVVVVVAVA